MKRMLRRLAVGLALAALPMTAAAPQGLRRIDFQQDLRAINGNWQLHSATSPDTASLVRFEAGGNFTGGTLKVLVGDNEGYGYAGGYYYERGEQNGRLRLLLTYGRSLIEQLPDNETQNVIIELRFTSADRAEYTVIEGGEGRGYMERSNCDLSFMYRAWDAPAPGGCELAEFRGVGYSGLDGDCRFDESWLDGWDRRPAAEEACLIVQPTGFPHN